jgi:hypothetical protein
MNKTIKILIGLLVFSITASIIIYYLLGWGRYVDITPILLCMFISIYGGSFAAIRVTYKKFIKLSYKHVGSRFFAILCTLSIVVFFASSYLIRITVPIYFKPGLTTEQVQRVYINSAILLFMPIKMFVGSFIGTLLAIKTTNINR